MPGSPQVLRIVARVEAPGATVNTASVASSDQFDPNTANNTATTASDPQQADLGLASSFDVPRPNVGDLVVYTITASDLGPAGLTGVSVAAPLPAGLSFVSSLPSLGSYDPVSGIWSVGSLAAGAPQTLRISARVTAPAAATATASVTSSDQFDPNTANNSTSTAITPRRSNLSLANAADVARPNVGDVVTFTVDLSNAGPDGATGVVVSDLLPAGLVFLGATGPGSHDPATGN